MTDGLETGLAPEVLASFFSRIRDIFEGMDRAYAEVAEGAGFHCAGCADSCCHTRFHHYTLVEVLYLLRGVALLAVEERAAAEERALQLCAAMKAHDAAGGEASFRGLCPLNVEGRCRVYAYRPMICRLHGVPWKMQGRGGEVRGAGCAAFNEGGDFCLDRTPHYQALAGLEQDLRRASGFGGRIRLSVADMLCLPMPEVGAGGMS